MERDPGKQVLTSRSTSSRAMGKHLRRLVVLSTLTTAVMGIGGPAAPTQAKVLGSNGRIVFARCITYASECEDFLTYTANPDGSNIRLLPSGASYSPDPRWSPDGSEIALAEPKTASACPGGSICTAIVVDPDTGTYRGLPWPLPGAWDVDCFAWSPDGTLLACGALDDNGTDLSGIYTVRSSDGGDPEMIVQAGPGFSANPSDFSPDGKRLVYALSEDDSNVGLFVARVNGMAARRVTPDTLLNAHGGSWSPSGNRIVFQAQLEGESFSIWMVNADGTGLHRVPIPGCGDTIRCRLPSWSPDGTKIVFSVRSPGPPSQVAGIYTVNADGTALSRVTNNGLGDSQPDWGTHPTS
jgi:Tol biopolymer transport system component